MEKKRILITGKGSYIGTSFINWVKQWPEQYEVEELSVRGEAWKSQDFSSYDAVLHLAGIAHVSADPKMEQEYYRVNRDLAIDVAKKAKNENVGQFIFMSSIIVYGDSGRINKKRVIDMTTIPVPTNFYGNSKLQAEKGIEKLKADNFIVTIIRPPMIYGQNSKGNYAKLSNFARILPIFPDINNQRSMLYIENLCEFIRFMVDDLAGGLFFPQNAEFVRTAEIVKLIAEIHHKKIRLTKVFNLILYTIGYFVGAINKAFGNLVYKKEISIYVRNYRVRTLYESIKQTETENYN
ncbi:NAD-dependent epimerase/dehydratase family protein [Paenibacillus albidus]|uniref:NAD-dependent epimerase/dehydratase family protein n=1 Tax=Paenibacillus albidus TaxID=2041023 RepID=UPI001BE66B3F|nr:NAD-dependent epimerase/dehydratase family protein [Paenibacillus albidus]MBT2290577.1 NAD-dependent epimerase/dehydratase family protein [Paenibacillus albidus]